MSDESLYREVEEEVRKERLQKIWRDYGLYVLILCGLLLLSMSAFKGWQYWQNQQTQLAAGDYFKAIQLQTDGQTAEASQKLSDIKKATGFVQLARLQEANLLASQGKYDEAGSAYEKISANTSIDSVFRDLASIRAAYLLIDSKSPEELAPKLEMFDKEGNSWRNSAREILALSAWRLKQYEVANRHFNAIFLDPDTPFAMRQRVQMVLQLLAPFTTKKS